MKLDNSAGLFGRGLQYAFYDWTRDMPWSRRVLTSVGLLIQLGALVFALSEPLTTSRANFEGCQSTKKAREKGYEDGSFQEQIITRSLRGHP